MPCALGLELETWQALVGPLYAHGRDAGRAETLLRGSFGNRTLPHLKIRGDGGAFTVNERVATIPAATIADSPAIARMIAAISRGLIGPHPRTRSVGHRGSLGPGTRAGRKGAGSGPERCGRDSDYRRVPKDGGRAMFWYLQALPRQSISTPRRARSRL